MSDVENRMVSALELGEWLGISEQHVRRHAVRGHVVKTGHGKYDLAASVGKYAEYLRQVAKENDGDAGNSAELTTERALLAREQREGHRISNEAKLRELVPVAEVEDRWRDLVSTATSRLYAVPALVLKCLPHLTAADIGKLDAEIRKGLKEFVQAKAI